MGLEFAFGVCTDVHLECSGRLDRGLVGGWRSDTHVLYIDSAVGRAATVAPTTATG